MTQPETALHFNVKAHLAAELQAAIGGGLPLRIREACLVGHWGVSLERRLGDPAPDGVYEYEWIANPCPEAREREWLAAWDRVELERRVGDARAARIPDVVLYAGDRVVGALEVLHTHAVDATKAESLAALGVPWVEVRADPALLAGETRWTVAAPLPVHRQGPESRWRCANHEFERLAADAEAERAREAARRTTTLRAVRVVDFYYPSGKHWRELYRAVAVQRDGAPYAVALQAGTYERRQVCEFRLADAPLPELWRRLQAGFDQDVAHAAARTAAIADSPMKWARCPLAEYIVQATAPTVYGQLLADTYPRRYRWARRQQRWFLPRDLRPMRWDRPPNDPLATPHPAWDRQPPPPRRPPAQADAGEMRRWPPRPVAVPVPHPLPAAPPAPAYVTPRESPPVARRDGLPEPPYRGTGPVPVEAFGATVREAFEHPAAQVVELVTPEGQPPRAVVVPRGRLASPQVTAFARWLASQRVEALWLSRKSQWSSILLDVPWLPLVRSAAGGYAVPIAGCAVPLSEAAAAFAAGDPAYGTDCALERALAATLPVEG